MPAEPLRMDLRCPHCSWQQECDERQIVQRLRGVGMLKRNPHATPAELHELLMAAAGRMTCAECGGVGLLATDAPEDDALWPAAKRCEVCGVPISVERLEIFPAAKACVSCQQAEDRGRATDEVEYCPKCGAPLLVRQTRNQGITRYVRTCSAIPPCRL